MIVVEASQLLVVVDLIVNPFYHSQLRGVKLFLNHVLVDDPHAVDLMTSYMQGISGHKVIGR